ncbi:MAG: TIGR03809 family protein [Rhizobiales bacterium]|nr:TIGR03809 family protein [Hyphomicrobiales bacterium]
MSARVKSQPYGDVAKKWRDLAERRCAHFVELYRSGRWTHYYTEEQFLARMREVIHAADTWAQIAREPDEHGIAAE